MLYTDCQSGRTAANAHHVSFARITCTFYIPHVGVCTDVKFVVLLKLCDLGMGLATVFTSAW